MVGKANSEQARRRVDQYGRARKGSQRHIQELLTDLSVLEKHLAGFISGFERGTLETRSPLNADRYREYRDRAMLKVLGLSDLAKELDRFWPAGGPSWDGLLVGRAAGAPVFILAEAKSHLDECRSACRAAGASLPRVRRALADVRQKLAVRETDSHALAWVGEYYQVANRLAFVQFLRDANVPAWLLNVAFANDRCWGPKAANAEEWAAFHARLATRMGLTSWPDFVTNLIIETPASCPRPT